MSETAFPAAWCMARASDICEKIQDGTHFSPKRQLPDGVYRYITAKNVRPQGLDLTDVTYLAEPDHRAIYERCDPKYGDVLLVKDGVNAGDCALNTLEEEFSLLSSVCFLRPKAAIVGGAFLRYYLLSPSAVSHLEGRLTGTAIRRIVLHRVRALPVRVAPIEEQRRIVEALETHLPRLDEAVATLERVQRKLKRYRASVLKAAVEGRLIPTEAELARAEHREYEPASELLKRILAERRRQWAALGGRGEYREPVTPDAAILPALPKGWCWATTDQLGAISGGLTMNNRRDALHLQRPYLRVANVHANELLLDEVKRIGVHEGEIERARLIAGDLLVVEGNGSVDQIGRVALWDGRIPDCLHQNHLIKVRFDLISLGRWCLTWLLSPSGRHVVERVASSTSGLHTLSISKVAALPVPLAPLAEQERVVAEVDRFASLREASSTQAVAALRRLARLRQSILKWAFEGKLVDQNPNNEPAAVLLERIKAERAAAAPATRARRVPSRARRKP